MKPSNSAPCGPSTRSGIFTPKFSGELGHQWGDLSQGGFDYTYWSAALTLGFNANPPLELEIRYLDRFDVNGFTCPPP